jgi:hypothetical protein
LLLVIVVLVLIRRRARRSSGERTPAVHVDESRDDLLVAIARLDLQYRNGELDDLTWSARRAELKARLAEHKSPEPAVE